LAVRGLHVVTRYGGKWLTGRDRCTEFSVGVGGGPWSLHGKPLGTTGDARRLGAF